MSRWNRTKAFHNEVQHTPNKVIDEYAAKGYRYVGWIPAVEYADRLMKIDLIFEKETGDDTNE